jgi:uncharacterized protein YkwD
MPTGAPGRWYPPKPRTPRARAAGRRRTGYLLCALLAVPVLVIGVLWALNGSGHGAVPVPAPAALSSFHPGTVTAQPEQCGAPCAASPIHSGLARVPAHSSRPHASASASGSASGSASASGSPSDSASSGAGSGRTAAPDTAASAPSSASGTAPATRSASAAAAASSGSSGSAADQVLDVINQARSAAGLPALVISSGLQASASAHDRTMAGGCGLSHQCAGEPALGARETAAGVTWTSAGENIGDGGPVADSSSAMAGMAVTLTQDMLNEKPPDDGHRLNILSSSFTHIGIDVYRDASGTVWMTQDFSG